MATLRSRCGHYIYGRYFCLVVSFFLSSSFYFSAPNLSGHRLDVYHTSTQGVALEMQDPQNRQKFVIWAPSRKFVGLYLRN